jgi:chromate transporter
VAVVAQAVFGMARSLAPDHERAAIVVAGMILAMLAPTALGQIGVIVLGSSRPTTLAVRMP